MWYNVSTANGQAEASKWRDQLASMMSFEDIGKAQAMATECVKSGYVDCGW